MLDTILWTKRILNLPKYKNPWLTTEGVIQKFFARIVMLKILTFSGGSAFLNVQKSNFVIDASKKFIHKLFQLLSKKAIWIKIINFEAEMRIAN